MDHRKMRKAIRTTCVMVAAAGLLFILVSCGEEKQSFDLGLLKIGEDVTLTYWMPRLSDRSTILDPAELLLYKELERVTGVHLVFEHPVYDQAQRQLELLRASDELADIMEWNWLHNYPEGPDAAINDGMILPLKDLILQHAPNLLKSITEDEEVMRAVTSATGRFYAFPQLRIDPETRAFGGLMIRRKWLDQIEYQIPTTINEWRNMLLTMRESDFGTIGRETEYPFFFPVFQFSFSSPAPTYFFLEETRAFAGTWGTAHGMFRTESGRIQYGPMQDEYYDMLTELNRWYEEGLIHPNIEDPGSGRSFMNTISKCGATIGAYDFADFLGPLDYVPAPPPVLDEGMAPIGSNLLPVYSGDRSVAISATSSNVVETVRFLDVAYSDWGYQLFNFGIEDESFEFVRGLPVLKEEILAQYEKISNSSSGLGSDLMKYTRILIGGPFVLSGSALKQIRDPEGLQTDEDNPWLLGARSPVGEILAHDGGRRAEYEKIMAPVTSHARSNFAAFLTGQRPLSEFEVFIREIENLNIGDAVSILYNAEAEFYTKPTW